jgi:stage IV sporulation protein B
MAFFYANNCLNIEVFKGKNNIGDCYMKKLFIALFILLIPINVWAYSDYIYLGGNTLGIEVNCDGVLIVGFYEINGKYNKGNPELKVGDYIVKIEDNVVSSLNELSKEIEKYAKNGTVKVTFKRNNKEYETSLKLIKESGVYKTGLFVKDSIIGIGTLTYIDPETSIYGALGHEIIESNTNEIVEIKSGKIFKNSINSIDKSNIGHAGSKNAKYYYNTTYGTIFKNTNHGIFGKYTLNDYNMELIEVGNPNDVKVGDAYIYTVLDNDKVEKFKINITSINSTSDTKNITFTITDEKLIKETGGVVQGMSGSPIVQNDKIIGVITHVIVDNPQSGYGLFITKMLEEGEK